MMANPRNNLTTRYGKDLHVFVPDDRNLNKSLDHFVNLYSLRTRKNREFWLLDVSNLRSAKEVSEKQLKTLPTLDLDDDLYLFETIGEDLKIWELYEIQPSLPRVLQQYGLWNKKAKGIQINRENVKWKRRRDLQVNQDS